jgi:adenine-specific DNA-methyltransferase
MTTDRKRRGAHYTPDDLAAFVASRLVGTLEGDGPFRVLDPAVGDGRLLEHLARSLHPRGVQLHGYDVNADAIAEVQQRFPADAANFHQADFLEHASQLPPPGDLFSPESEDLYDLVISNPPYVRTHWLDEGQRKQVGVGYQLPGRADFSFAFIMALARVLKPGGTAALILSNRFLFTKAGSAIRAFLPQVFQVLELWDLGDTRIFAASVLPAVLVLRRTARPVAQQATWTRVYEGRGEGQPEPLFDALPDPCAKLAEYGDREFVIERGTLNIDGRGQWILHNLEKEAWLDTVNAHTRNRFADLGPVRVGVKTTADTVFLRRDGAKDFAKLEPNFVRPLVSSTTAQRWAVASPTERILYPYKGTKTAQPADLTQFPKTLAYLESHRQRLEGRKYVQESGRLWWEIWVPQKPAIWDGPLLACRDISDKPVFFMTEPGTCLNGDCYFVDLNGSAGTDLPWLALGVANSTFLVSYYDARFGNRLYAQRRRYITQYVREFPLPDLKTEASQRVIALARELHQITLAGESDLAKEAELDRWVHVSFGLGLPPVNKV